LITFSSKSLQHALASNHRNPLTDRLSVRSWLQYLVTNRLSLPVIPPPLPEIHCAPPASSNEHGASWRTRLANLEFTLLHMRLLSVLFPSAPAHHRLSAS
jgi:hypothetical protein